MKAKIGILSLGCARNLVDSEGILGRLRSKGHEIVDLKDADVAIVNTCAFVEDAKKESIDAILDVIELKRKGKIKKIIVHGCLSQRYKDELRKELSEVDAFVGKVALDPGLDRFPIAARHYAYLKICEGCINNCSFCIIPKIKGRFTSLDESLILRKVRQFGKDKLSELNIIGQDITGYGIDHGGKPRLEALLRDLLKNAQGIGWIRLLYLNPERVTDELLGIIREAPKICKYIDLPIQHINDRILRLMKRGSKKKDIAALVHKIRKAIPGVALRTSVIVGFPTETDKEFKELVSFIEDAGFERLGAFIYSREEGTAAYSMKGQIPRKIKDNRFDAVMSVQQKVSRQVNLRLMGKIIDVLIDETKDECYLGRSRFDAPEVDGMVYVNSAKSLKPGDFVKVRVTDTLEYDLVGETV